MTEVTASLDTRLLASQLVTSAAGAPIARLEAVAGLIAPARICAGFGRNGVFQSLWKNCERAFWGFAVEFFCFEGRENFEAVGDAAEGGVFAVKVRGGR